MKILFLNLSTLKFDVATPDNAPLGGSESCVSYLARQLAVNGHDVCLIARLPDNTPAIVKKVRHFSLATVKDKEFFDYEKFDTIIACNTPIACPHLREISPSSLLLLWDHVPPDQPSMHELGNPEIQNAIDGIVYVSEWQKLETEKKFGISKNSVVIGNGLTPSFENMFSSAQDLLQHKQNRAAYTVIPYRGLPLLLKVMQGLQQDTQLDIYSSMKVYQQADDEYARLYRDAVKDPRIHYHGSVSQQELAQRLKPAAFLTYPCICAETFCIAALEALAAGMTVISTHLGPLETTTMGFAELLPIEPAQPDDFINRYREAMNKHILLFKNQPEAWAENRFEQVRVVNQQCSWKVRTSDWEKLLMSPRL